MLSMDCEAEKVYRIDIYAIRNRLLCQLHSALIHLLPNGKVRNRQFYVGNIKGDYGESLKVELEGQKAGLWQDFATGEGGDIFDLWAKVKGLDVKREFPALIEEIEVWLGVSGNKIYHHKASANYSYKWNYVDKDGNTIAVVFRYDTEDGGKKFSMWDEKMQRYKAPDVRPLYNLQGIAKSDRVILVEGEKCAQALIDEGVCATTLMGGANTPLNKTDWLPLNGKEVVIWPDNDEVGKAYGERVAEFLKPKPVKSISVLKIDCKPEKWDAAFRDAESLISKGESLLTSLYGGVVDTPAGLKEVQGKVFSELELNFNSQLNNLETQKTTLEEVNTLAENTAKLQKEALELQQKAAVAQSAGETQSIEAELTALRQRQVEASKALLAAEEKLIREKFKLAAEVLTSIVKSVGKLLTDNKQEEINKLKLQESIISQSLATTTENLSKAQERQKESLSKEISLRDELKAATDSLVEKQKEYIQALTGDDRSIVESGKLYIKTLLDQKKKAIELSKTVSERIRLDAQVKSLEERKLIS